MPATRQNTGASLEEEIEELKEQLQKSEEKSQERLAKIRTMREERHDLQTALHDKDQRIAKLERKSNSVRQEHEKMTQIHQDQLFQAKQNIAASTRLDKQMGDEAFQRCMDKIYERFRDCFLRIRRRQDFDIRTQREDGFLEKFLAKRVPGFKDNTADDKLHVCICVVSLVLMHFVNNQFVFGHPCKKPIRTAWCAWLNLERSRKTESQKEMKQWLALTDDILTRNNSKSMDRAKEASLNHILDNMKKVLEAATTLEFTDAIRRTLSNAISPHLETLRMLHFQEWEYNLRMQSTSYEDGPVPFHRGEMEGMFYEEKGFVKAVLFPQLRRLEEGSGDDDEDDEYTVICKARVAAMDTENNMEEAEEGGMMESDGGEIKVEQDDNSEKKGESKVVLDSFEEGQNQMDEIV